MTQTVHKRTAAKSRQTQEKYLRRQIAQLLGVSLDEIREWNTCLCPDCRENITRAAICNVSDLPHLSPLFYALAPEQANGDMPLGVGADSVAALTDLLWNVKLDVLLSRLAADL